MVAIHAALRGLTARQRAIADNIANIETPGYTAERVDFEASLRKAMADGNPADTSISVTRSTAPTGMNGNNVQLDDEVVAAMETNLRYQVGTQAMSNKFNVLRTAIGKGA
jgi:flagellar basal-body rod protein FlgB